MSDPDALPKVKQAILIYNYGYPQMKKVPINKIFRTDDVISQENLNRTTVIRDELSDALATKNTNAIIKASEKYFPLLFGLVVSVESNPQLRLNEPLNFSWSSCWDTSKKPHYYTCYTYKYEVVMALIAYAIANVNRSFEMLISCSDADFAEKSKNALTYLRTAAGIFQYISAKELPRWSEGFPDKKPFEMTPDYIRAQVDYLSGLAQTVMIKKGLLGGTSEGALSKLAVDVWKKYETVELIIKKIPNYKDELPSVYLKFLGLQVQLSKSYAYKYLGHSAYNAQKYGVAMTYLQQASHFLENMWMPTAKDLQGKYCEEIQSAKDDIEHVKRTYENENNHIYYQKAVEPATLEIPDGKDMNPPIEYIPPQPDYKSLH